MTTLPQHLSATTWAERKAQEAANETAILRETPTAELYDAVEDHITARSSSYAREWSPDYRREHKAELRRLRRELNRRGLPSRKRDYDLLWQERALQEAADICDLRDTERCAI